MTVAAAPPPPAPAQTGYQGGALARAVTSNSLRPVESLVGQRGRDQELRERDRQQDGIDEDGESPHRDLEKGGRRDGEEVPGGRQAKEGEELVVTDGGEALAEEWTFPDGGWKAWSVILVRVLFLPSRRKRRS
ncbi:hypothetical protein JCM8097_008270 [Rhodosporidiobolus ruineniae]